MVVYTEKVDTLTVLLYPFYSASRLWREAGLVR